MASDFPEEAETAFYEALEKGDLEAMMAIWADDEEVVCIHPGGQRLTGQSLIVAMSFCEPRS